MTKIRRRKKTKPTIFFIGIGWPPTTFIARKLKVLAESGKFNIIVGISSPYKRTDFSFKIPGIKLIKLSHTEDPILIRLFYLIRYSILLFFRSPKKYCRILALAHSESRNIKVFFNKLLDFIVIASYDFDLAHFEWVATAFNFLPLLNYFNIPYTISARGWQFNINPLLDISYRKNLQQTIKNSSKIHCVSSAMEKVVKQYDSNAKTTVIYNGIDTQFFRGTPEQFDSTYLNIIFIGSLIWRKSIDSVLYIFHKFLSLGGQGKLHIVGDGYESEKMWFGINDLSLNNHAIYHGKLKEKQVAQLLKNMDVLLLPSFGEGLANVILEAMASYTIPIVSDAQGNPEPIDQGKNGFVFPILDMQKPVEYLIKLYKDPVLLREMKIKARKTIEEKFTLRHMQEGHVKFFEEVLKCE